METYEKHELPESLRLPMIQQAGEQEFLRAWRAPADGAGVGTNAAPDISSYDGMSRAASVQQRIDERMNNARDWSAGHPTPGPPLAATTPVIEDHEQ